MHELSICMSMLEQVTAVATRESAEQVTAVVARVGPLSGVVPELLQQAFPLAAAGTLAEGAELRIESLPIIVRCSSCGAESEALPNRLVCDICGDYRTELVSGDELLLASIELERTEQPLTQH